jgi:hypothetical protein
MMPIRTSTKRTIKVLGILMAAVVLAVAWHGVHRVAPDKLDALIHQKLPPGTDETGVITFLNLQHIAHTDYDPQRKTIQAGVNKSSIGLLTGRIHIDFWFDENGKLSRYDLVELFDFL